MWFGLFGVMDGLAVRSFGGLDGLFVWIVSWFSGLHGIVTWMVWFFSFSRSPVWMV